MRRLFPLLLLLTACSETPTGDAIEPAFSAAVQQDLASLRAATAPFHRHAEALAAGYQAQFPPGCLESAEGGMGFHYLNESLVGTLDPARPQLVIYEPQPNGALRLVGVEFIAPGASTDAPPVLFDQAFAWSDVYQVWVLHVWTGRSNPRGLFASYNPRVSCAAASAITTAAHH